MLHRGFSLRHFSPPTVWTLPSGQRKYRRKLGVMGYWLTPPSPPKNTKLRPCLKNSKPQMLIGWNLPRRNSWGANHSPDLSRKRGNQQPGFYKLRWIMTESFLPTTFSEDHSWVKEKNMSRIFPTHTKNYISPDIGKDSGNIWETFGNCLVIYFRNCNALSMFIKSFNACKCFIKVYRRRPDAVQIS